MCRGVIVELLYIYVFLIYFFLVYCKWVNNKSWYIWKKIILIVYVNIIYKICNS